MTSAKLLAILALSLMTAVASWPSPSQAHAFPSGAEPAVGSTVSSPPSKVVIHFDNPIEALFTKLDVFDGRGNNEAAGAPVVEADHLALDVALKPIGPGEYTVKWSVVAADGHRTEGSFTFTVARAGS
jgi:methionine-rich copper-binding protein CopC